GGRNPFRVTSSNCPEAGRRHEGNKILHLSRVCVDLTDLAPEYFQQAFTYASRLALCYVEI
ncbi:MAG: hypothetical protein ACRYG8_30715, partial [Janthinobacterium lividum]